jgi:hypothetical protein
MKPGIYFFTCDVKNPCGDRRVTREFARQPIWEKGTRVCVRARHFRRDIELPPELSNSLEIFEIGGYAHDGFDLDRAFEDPKKIARIAAVTAPGVLEPEPRSLESELYLRHEEYDANYTRMLEVLIKTGKVTIDQALEALDISNAED